MPLDRRAPDWPDLPADAEFTDEGWLIVDDEAYREEDWEKLSTPQRRSATHDVPRADETKHDRYKRLQRASSRRRKRRTKEMKMGEERIQAALLLLHWAETTHDRYLGHDHHCPAAGPADAWLGEPNERCNCGWTKFRTVYDKLDAEPEPEPA
jgi:hypothetical protein